MTSSPGLHVVVVLPSSPLGFVLVVAPPPPVALADAHVGIDPERRRPSGAAAATAAFVGSAATTTSSGGLLPPLPHQVHDRRGRPGLAPGRPPRGGRPHGRAAVDRDGGPYAPAASPAVLAAAAPGRGRGGAAAASSAAARGGGGGGGGARGGSPAVAVAPAAPWDRPEDHHDDDAIGCGSRRGRESAAGHGEKRRREGRARGGQVEVAVAASRPQQGREPGEAARHPAKQRAEGKRAGDNAGGDGGLAAAEQPAAHDGEESMMLMQSNSNFLSMSASFIAPPPLIIPHSQSMTVLSQSNKSTSFPSSQLASSPTIPPTEPGAPTTPPPGANLPPPPPMDLTPPTTPPGFDLPPPPPVDVGPPTAPPNDLPPPFIPPPTDPALSSVATSITTSSPLSSMYGSPLSPNSLAPTATGDWVHALDSEQLEQLPQKLKKRQQVANEILVTEKTYVDVLNIIVEKFFYPLKKDGLGVSKNEVYEMFSNIEVIRDCHERLKQSISKVVECWGDNSGLSEIFLATGWIRFYKYYVNNYGVSMSTLRIAREKHPAFSAYLKGLDYSKALNGLNLEGLLIAPVQRIPRYVLLLSDMLRSTPSVHPDFHGLTEALHVIKELADYVNLQKQISDNQAELDVIQAKIKGYDGSDLSGVKKRKFIKAGDLEINKTMSRLWLFSDLIIVTLPESKKGTFKYKSTVNLKTASAQPCDGVRFAIVALEGTKNCKAVSTTEAEEWRAAISNAISAQQESMLQDLFTKRDTAESEGSKVFEEHRDAEYEEKRENMVSQLLATEADYVSYLTLTYETYLLPIKKAADSGGAMIKPAIAEQVLSNFEALVRIHKEFHEDVKQRQEEWQSNKTLTDLFEKYEKPFFQPLYTQYVSHKPSQLKALVAAQTNEIFNFWLRDLESRERGDLKVLLERPMKRVSDYYLLTQEMLQSTTKKHPDFDKLSHIVTSLKSLSGDLARLAVSEPSATSRSRSKSTSSKLSGH
ncbi:rho guanine nucleotide exchange factor 17 [Pelomyxa schiedti]|nr:rho guanine nucleotide exchange factor 17 [Pelomyxa schiedti]